MNSPSNRLISNEDECLWIESYEVDMIHAELLLVHGGLEGTKDTGALKSALLRPQQKLHYATKPLLLSELAAAYAYGISSNHPYNDGNKRVAFTVANVFLMINGARIQAEQTEVVKTVLSLASGNLAEEDLAHWIAEHLELSKS